MGRKLYVANAAGAGQVFNHIGRIDHNFSDRHRVYGRVSVSRKIDVPYRNYWEDVAMANNYLGKTRQFAFDDVYTFSPSLVMNIRYGYIRLRRRPLSATGRV